MTTTRPKTAVREDNERALVDAAETVFAEEGYRGATTAEIAARAGVPKANLHYYFPTKEALYRRVIARVLRAWLGAADGFSAEADPAEALAAYIGAKMDLARSAPLASRVFANEVLRGAPVVRDYIETTVADWLRDREAVVRAWIAAGRLHPVEPRALIYLIWAATQHYADFATQIAALNGGEPLDDAAFETAKREVVALVLRGVAPAPRLPDRREGS